MRNNRILVIEDEERIRSLVRTFAAKEGLTAEEAADGKTGLAMATDGDYAVVIVDIMLPGIDGWTVCREIRAVSHVPIIILTARGEEYDRLHGFELGVDDYVVKPFSPKELIARIKALIKRTEPGAAAGGGAIEAFGLRIDADTRQVFRDGAEIPMTPKEFDLLFFLASNRRKAFSREQLMNGVWGYDYFGDARTVDTHIKQLREKLGDSERKIIRTVWGTGYMMPQEDGK
jgi:two-component system response regulator ResD